jgi:hypothetical protein
MSFTKTQGITDVFLYIIGFFIEIPINSYLLDERNYKELV